MATLLSDDGLEVTAVQAALSIGWIMADVAGWSTTSLVGRIGVVVQGVALARVASYEHADTQVAQCKACRVVLIAHSFYLGDRRHAALAAAPGCHRD